MRAAAPYLILTGAMALVAWLCLAPVPLPQASQNLPALLAPYDHVILYAALGLVVSLSWPGRALYAVPLLLVLAIGLEAAQGLIPARAYESLDLLANLLGVALGAGSVWLMRELKLIRESLT